MNKLPQRLKLILILVLIPASILLLAWLILMLPVSQQRIIRFAEGQVERVLIGDCSIGHFSTNFLTSAKLSDIKLVYPDNHGDSIYIRSVKAYFNIFSLFSKRVDVRSVEIDEINALLTVSPDGQLMIPALPDSQFLDSIQKVKIDSSKVKTPTDWVVFIGKARAIHVNATYSDSALNFVGKVQNATAEATLFNYDSMDLRLAVPDGSFTSPWWSGPVDTISSSGLLTSKGLAINDVVVKGILTNVTGTGYIPFSDTGNWDLSADVQTSVASVNVLHETMLFLEKSGSINLVASWKGTLRHPVLSCRASGEKWATTHFSIPSLSVAVTYDGDSLIHTRSSLVTGVGNVKCSSKISIPLLFKDPVVKEYSMGCFMDNIDLSRIGIPDSLKKYIPWQRGNAALYAAGQGTNDFPDTISAHTILQSSDLKFNNATVNFDLTEEQWNVFAAWGKSEISGHGTTGKQGVLTGFVNGSFGQVSGISRLFTGEKIDGALLVKGKLEGTLSKPGISIEAVSSSLTWRSVTADSLLVRLKTGGRGTVLEPSFVSLRAGIDTVASYFGVKNAGGNLFLDAMISGELDRPDISGICTINNLVYGSITADSVSVIANVNNLDSVGIGQLRLYKKNAGIDCTGKLSLNSRFLDFVIVPSLFHGKTKHKKGSVHLYGSIDTDSVHTRINGNSVDISIVNEWIPFNDSLKGICSFIGQVDGRIRDPEGFFEFTLDNGGYNDLKIKSVNGKMSLRESLVNGSVEVTIADAESPLNLTMAIPVHTGNVWYIDQSGNRAGKVHVSGNDIVARDLIKILGGDWNSNGFVQCDIDLESVKNDWNASGVVIYQSALTSNKNERIRIKDCYALGTLSGTLKHPRVGYLVTTDSITFSGGIIDSAFLRGEMCSDTLRCDTARLSLPHDGLLDINVTVPLDKADSLLLQPGLEVNFTVVRFPLRLLAPLLPENLLSGGNAHGDGRIRINKGRPVLSGSVFVDSVKMNIEDITPGIGPFSAVIEMSNDSLLLKSLDGMWGSGLLAGNGAIVWSTKGISAMNISTTGKNISFEIIDVFSVNIPEMDATITKQGDEFAIRGNIDLGPSRYYRDVRITDLIAEPTAGSYEVTTTDSVLNRINLQLKLRFLESPVVDMNLGYFELGGNCMITGTAQSPSYIGEIVINEGYVVYLDRQFEVNEGSFVNYDPLVLNPVINLKAQTEVFTISNTSENENFTIYLDVSGTLDNPKVTLSDKSGELKEADIISILTLGQRLGSVGDDLGERLKALAGQSILGFGTRRLEQALKMDKINIQGDIFKIGAKDKTKTGSVEEKLRNSPTLTLSKRISPRLIVTYENALDDLTQRRITALFRLTRRLFIKGNADSDDYGLDLILKYSR